jgi:hypothetical protein
LDPWRHGISGALDDARKLLGERLGFGVGEVKQHQSDIGVATNGRATTFDWDTMEGASRKDKPMMYLEDILQALYDSEINASISWLWDGGIDVKLGDELTGYDAEGQVSTFAEATAWFRGQACRHYPDSGFARKYCGFV